MLEWKAFSSVVSQADWAELACILNNRQLLAGAEMQQYLNREINEEDAEFAVENIRGQISWRKTQMPAGYPFAVSGGNIIQSADWHDFLPYTFMLLLSTHDFFDETRINRWNEIAKLFERTVNAFVKLHLGNAINIGSPRIPKEAPKSFQKCINHVAIQMNESKGVSPRISWHKDGGVDVIGWKKLDERPGKIVFLVQCAAGESWRDKEMIPLESWREWIFFATKPIEVLAFPSIYFIGSYPEEEESWRFCCQGRLLMDRLRLAAFDSTGLPADLRTAIGDWCDQQLINLSRAAE